MHLLCAPLVLITTALLVEASNCAAPAIPGFALQYAPIVYLYDKENYLPSDIGEQLKHTTPKLNYTTIKTDGDLTLDNLAQLNGKGGSDVYLTSNDDISKSPSWLFGVKPDATGKTEGAVSSVIIVVEKGDAVVDVFYMYFYAYNYGGDFFGLKVDDHVGDWEHTMIRFQDGAPQAVWYSQHSNGEAFKYAVTEKYNGGVRPVAYSANGTHANYATSGSHDIAVPGLNLGPGAITDQTSKGAVWDVTLNSYHVKYDPTTKVFLAYSSSGHTPTSWLEFVGHWGDKMYPRSDPRQSCPFDNDGLCVYANGPTGPEDKQLDRKDVCPDNGNPCTVRTSLGS